MKRMLSGLLTGLLLMQPLYAQESVPLPRTQTVGAVTFLSGGIGSDEAAAMKRAASSYALELVFVVKTTNSEQYAADVQIRVMDKAGAMLLDTVAAGPFLLANLPDGTYRIEAVMDGITKKQTAVVKSGSHRRLVFVWADRSSGAVDMNDLIAPTQRQGRPRHLSEN